MNYSDLKNQYFNASTIAVPCNQVIRRTQIKKSILITSFYRNILRPLLYWNL